MSATENNRGRIHSLQGLRVLAFIGIFLWHAVKTPAGAWGVSVFIMLSGFLMVYSYWDRWDGKAVSVKGSVKFSIRKIKPLYPLHLIMLAAAFIPYHLVPLMRHFSWSELLKNAFKLVITVPLIQAWFPVGYEAINTVAWYLSAMLFLYAVFPFILRFLKRNLSIQKIVLLMILAYAAQFAFAFACRYLPYLKEAHWSNYILPLFRLGDFFIGCCLGYCFISTERKSAPVLSTVCEILFFALAVLGMIAFQKFPKSEWFTDTLVFVPSSAGIVYVLAGSDGLISKLLATRPFQIAAAITPFAFLIHRQILNYTESLYELVTGDQIHPVLLVAVAMAVTVALSCLYKWATGKKKKKNT